MASYLFLRDNKRVTSSFTIAKGHSQGVIANFVNNNKKKAFIWVWENNGSVPACLYLECRVKCKPVSRSWHILVMENKKEKRRYFFELPPSPPSGSWYGKATEKRKSVSEGDLFYAHWRIHYVSSTFSLKYVLALNHISGQFQLFYKGKNSFNFQSEADFNVWCCTMFSIF